jgi:hypothetical protein
VSTQCAHLRIAKVGVGAFCVAAVPKAHELDFRIDPGSGFDPRYVPEEVPPPTICLPKIMIENCFCGDVSRLKLHLTSTSG